MKVLGFIIIGIVFITVIFIGVALISNNQKVTKETAEKKASETAQKTVLSAEDKLQKAQGLLSKKTSSPKDQEEAKRLILESINEAKKATEVQPKSVQTWNYLSETYQKLRDIDPRAAELSIDALNHAIPLAPEDAKLLNERATMYIFLKKYKEAEIDLQKALQINPKGPNHYYKLGNIYKELGRKDLARTMYIQAKKLTLVENKMAHAQIDYQMKELEKKEIKNQLTPR